MGPVEIACLCDNIAWRAIRLECFEFGHGASVIWIKVDFHGLASVSFIYSDTTGFQSADYCQGCWWPLVTGCGTLCSCLIWLSWSCLFTSVRQIPLQVNNQREPSYISGSWTASPIALHRNRQFVIVPWLLVCLLHLKNTGNYSWEMRNCSKPAKNFKED